ncbi:hypothetical protein N6N73_03070 [Escherichia albertii]|uniref:hypothetical protein n=1 Tax=Escherichia albertii TaxID=208962 RepID=UPI000743A1E3|nr:hypothetical protein [Escherichia albertii]EGM8072807.1 hypothetical protein [Escherichia albertii]MCU7265196.1 hypothetical protein [Escherichia albertii]MCU7286824.1 hypothetical protein [Escherichia albertii]MCU7324703.1 hypothetical protein [Escherichia albertii]WDC15504.1 hypothetical protein PS055_19330 [Escherichia albertii]
MSNIKIKQAIEKIAEFRAASAAMADAHMVLITDLLNSIEDIRKNSGDNLSEFEKGQVALYIKISPVVKNGISSIEKYNESLSSDYVEAMNSLSKIAGGNSNVD